MPLGTRPCREWLALMLAVALLITPSMTHQIAYRGDVIVEERFGSHQDALAWPESR